MLLRFQQFKKRETGEVKTNSIEIKIVFVGPNISEEEAAKLQSHIVESLPEWVVTANLAYEVTHEFKQEK